MIGCYYILMQSVTSLIARYALISDQVSREEVRIILTELEQTLQNETDGQIVELGCYVGTTSLFLSRFIQGTGRKLYVYDSFEGLPEKSRQDQSPVGEQFKAGELSISKREFVGQFKKAGLALPVVTKCWFKDLSPVQMPAAIAFAYLDGDYYESIRDSLRLVWPHLTEGAVVVIDDYVNEALPGAARAVDEWLLSHPAKLRIQSSLAILSGIRKS